MTRKQGKERKKLFTISQLAGVVGAGIILGTALVFLPTFAFFGAVPPEVDSPAHAEMPAAPPIYSKNITACTALCAVPPEKEPVPVPRKVPPKTAGAKPGIVRLADLPKKIKNPNAIRISLAEAPPILAKVKKVNGRSVCAKKNDKGSKSDKYNYVHVDQECCLDPDEIPNPRCWYQ